MIETKDHLLLEEKYRTLDRQWQVVSAELGNLNKTLRLVNLRISELKALSKRTDQEQFALVQLTQEHTILKRKQRTLKEDAGYLFVNKNAARDEWKPTHDAWLRNQSTDRKSTASQEEATHLLTIRDCRHAITNAYGEIEVARPSLALVGAAFDRAIEIARNEERALAAIEIQRLTHALSTLRRIPIVNKPALPPTVIAPPLALRLLRKLWDRRIREVDPIKKTQGYLHRFQIDADLEAEIREVIGE